MHPPGRVAVANPVGTVDSVAVDPVTVYVGWTRPTDCVGETSFLFKAVNLTGAFPKDDLLRSDDVTATVFHALGLDPATEIRDQLGRPTPISAGQPVKALFG
jgi:hypothetical protein